MTIDSALGRVVDEVETVVLDRHRKYGPKNIADAPGGPLNGLAVRLFDKLARLDNYVHRGEDDAPADFDDDSLRDCFVDVCGYGLIGLLVLDGEWPGVDPDEPIPYTLGGESAVTEGWRATLDAAFRNAQRDYAPIEHETPPDSTEYTFSRGWRWAELFHDDAGDPYRLDAWALGTTFKSDDDNYPDFATWTRGPGGWRMSSDHDDPFPSLRAVIDRIGYRDGVITEPPHATNAHGKAAA